MVVVSLVLSWVGEVGEAGVELRSEAWKSSKSESTVAETIPTRNSSSIELSVTL